MGLLQRQCFVEYESASASELAHGAHLRSIGPQLELECLLNFHGCDFVQYLRATDLWQLRCQRYPSPP